MESVVLGTCLGDTLKLYVGGQRQDKIVRSRMLPATSTYIEVRKKAPRKALRSSRVLVVGPRTAIFGLRRAWAVGAGEKNSLLKQRSVVIAIMRCTRFPTCELRSTWSWYLFGAISQDYSVEVEIVTLTNSNTRGDIGGRQDSFLPWSTSCSWSILAISLQLLSVVIDPVDSWPST